MNTQPATLQDHTATYSPEDDKIRIYPAYRLPRHDYDALKTAGFQWAPKQECFYSVWTPNREATALIFAAELDDEDKSLIDRAEERADRFDEYRENRAKDAEQAHKAVAAIADGIPFGQPILVGHHSERHARKDAERIENGMKRAVKMWDTAQYWTRRAAAAISHAKYKERPDVRARRIKTIEADKRKQERTRAEAETWLTKWSKPGLTLDEARNIANHCWLTVSREDGHNWTAYDVLRPDEDRYKACPAWTVEQVQEVAARVYPATIAHCDRWINHYDNRLAYERAMLAEAGGLAADKFNFEVGGQVRHRFGWNYIKRLNKKDGILLSLSLVSNSYPTVVNVEDVKEYKPPTEEQAATVKAATKTPPMCNYERPGCATMTQAEYTAVYKDSKGGSVIAATETHAAHRMRHVQGFIGRRHGGTAADQWTWIPVFISDATVKPAPLIKAAAEPVKLPPTEPTPPRPAYRAPVDDTPPEIAAMRDTLKAGGVKTVSAPQLFPTPPAIAARMVELADIHPGHTVLEPSAGTGNIVAAILAAEPAADVMTVEINPALSQVLANKGYSTLEADFLNCHGETLGKYDRIVMNPPFINAADIKHIEHARAHLKPGGCLIALCANGPRQQAAFRDTADLYEELPAGSFSEQGTNVNVAIVIFTMSEAPTAPRQLALNL